MTLDSGVEPPVPIAQMGLLRPPGEGGAAGGHESEGELGSRPALPAVAGSNSRHFLLTLVPREAWAAGGGQRVGGHRREDPSCAYGPATSPCSLTGPTQPTPHASQISKAGQTRGRTGFLSQVYILMSLEGTTGKPLLSDPQCPLASNKIET